MATDMSNQPMILYIRADGAGSRGPRAEEQGMAGGVGEGRRSCTSSVEEDEGPQVHLGSDT